MRKGIAIILTVLVFVLVGCEETTLTVISSTTTLYNFSLESTKDANVDECVFTIDTVKHLIYNEDSLDFGTDVDSLIPIMAQTFARAVIADTINLYKADTTFVDFTHPQKLTITSSAGDTASYMITVNVHTVQPDTFIWKKVFDLGTGICTEQKAVITDNDVIYWMMRSASGLEMMSSRDGKSWKEVRLSGLPSTVDITHLIACGDKICLMDGNDLYSFSGKQWEKSVTTSDVAISHLLFTFRGDKYALGAGNAILKLVGTEWEIAEEMYSGFPVEGECAFIGESVTGRPIAYIACGIDDQGRYLSDVWSSENGNYWVKLTVKDSLCSPRAYAAVIQYGKGLLMLGGVARDSVVVDNFLFSKDYGISWQDADDVYEIDTHIKRQGYRMRSGLSLVRKGTGEVFVIGGRDINGNMLSDVWYGLNYASIPGFEK